MPGQTLKNKRLSIVPRSLAPAILSGLFAGVIASALDVQQAHGYLDSFSGKLLLTLHTVGRLSIAGAVFGLAASLILSLEDWVLAKLPIRRTFPKGLFLTIAASPFLIYITTQLWQGGSMSRLPAKGPLTLLTIAALVVFFWLGARTALALLAWSERKPTPRHMASLVALAVFLVGLALRTCDANMYRRLYLYLHTALGCGTLGCFAYALRISVFSRPTTKQLQAVALPAIVMALTFFIAGTCTFNDRQSIKVVAWDQTATLSDYLRSLSAMRSAPMKSIEIKRDITKTGTVERKRPVASGKWPVLPDSHVLLITIDALRADRLGTYGYKTFPSSTNIDRFADNEGIVFERAYCTAPHSSFSITSLHTSRYTHDEAMLSQDLRQPTLAEVFGDSGYKTMGFYTQGIFFTEGDQVGYYRRAKYGFQNVSHGAFRAEEFTDRVVAEIDRLIITDTNTPWFIWVHYFNVHEPYESTRFGESTETRYISEIYEADAQVIRLIRHVQSALNGKVVVALTADHGEEFKDHGGYYHGSSLYDEQVRVPFIINVPGVKPHRVHSPISLVDVAPTLLSIVGIPPPTSMLGQDLRPAIFEGDESNIRLPVFASVMRHHMVVIWPWKLIADPSRDIYELYNLVRDPREQANKYDQQPRKANELLNEIYNQLDEIGKSQDEAHTALNLGEMRDPRAVPGLIRVASNNGAPRAERERAIELLGEIENQAAIDPLRGLLDDHNDRIAILSALALGNLGDMSGRDLMLDALFDEDPDVRDQAALVLGHRGEKAAASSLVEALGRNDVQIREQAIRALGRLAEPSTVEPLIEALDEERTRYLVVLALGKTGDPRALKPLIEVVRQDRHPDVRGYAVVGLGWLGRKEAIPTLLEVLQEQPEIKWTAESLVRLNALGTGRLFGTDAKKGLPTLVRGFGNCTEKPKIIHGDFLGRTVCRSVGKTGTLSFYADAPEGGIVIVRVRHLLPIPEREASFSIRVDGKLVASPTITGQFREFRIDTPKGTWLPTKHNVTLELIEKGAFELDHFLVLARQ